MSNKQKIINDIYFDKSGFSSRAITLKDARQKDKSITMQTMLMNSSAKMLKREDAQCEDKTPSLPHMHSGNFNLICSSLMTLKINP